MLTTRVKVNVGSTAPTIPNDRIGGKTLDARQREKSFATSLALLAADSSPRA